MRGGMQGCEQPAGRSGVQQGYDRRGRLFRHGGGGVPQLHAELPADAVPALREACVPRCVSDGRYRQGRGDGHRFGGQRAVHRV